MKDSIIKLGEIANIIMGQSPSGETYNKIGQGVPLLNGPTEFGPSHPIPALWTTHPTRLSQIGDLLFCVRGSTTGRMNWADQAYCLGRGVGAFRAKTSSTDTRFLFYGLRHRLSDLLGLSAGSVFPNLSKQDIETFKLYWPDRETRSKIVAILGALDDKIELNRKMNETLEAIARAIFKSWFVDFDPVKAKAEGRQPFGMDAETADLFPNSFVESALGKIPNGWKSGSLYDIIELIGGGTPKTTFKEYWNGDIPWFSMADIPNPTDVFVIDTQKKITQAGLKNSATRLLSVGTTIVTARGTVGKCALVTRQMAMNQSCYGIRGREKQGNFFTFFMVKHLLNDLKRNTHGSIFDTITQETFKSVKVPCPPIAFTQLYDAKVSAYLSMILNNLEESQTLAANRDTLLPKLMSGEVKPEAQRE